MRFRLIVFDLDGVLVEEPSAWGTLHKAFGTYEASKENLKAYESGIIDYPEFMRRDIRLWRQRHINEVEAILHNFTLTRGAFETCEFLKFREFQLAIVSAGIDILVRVVSEKLKIKNWIANGLEIDTKGFLTGEGIFRVDLMEKHLALKELIKPLGIKLSDTIAVGDSKYDITLMKACGTGIAFLKYDTFSNCDSWAAPWEKIYSLEELPNVLSKIQEG